MSILRSLLTGRLANAQQLAQEKIFLKTEEGKRLLSEKNERRKEKELREDRYIKKLSLEFNISKNTAKSLRAIAKITKKKGQNLKNVYREKLGEFEEAANRTFELVDERDLSDFLRKGYEIEYNRDFMTKAEFLFDLKLFTQSLGRPFFYYKMGIEVDRRKKKYTIRQDNDLILEISNGTQSGFEDFFKFKTVQFKNTDIRFDSK